MIQFGLNACLNGYQMMSSAVGYVNEPLSRLGR